MIIYFRCPHCLLYKHITLVVMRWSKYFKVDSLRNFWLSGPLAVGNYYSMAHLSVQNGKFFKNVINVVSLQLLGKV